MTVRMIVRRFWVTVRRWRRVGVVIICLGWGIVTVWRFWVVVWRNRMVVGGRWWVVVRFANVIVRAIRMIVRCVN